MARAAGDEATTLLAALDDSESQRISGTMRKAGLGKAAIRCWNEIDPMLRLQATIGSPVGGITVVKHFEVNVCPVVLQLTRSTIAKLVDFFAVTDNLAEKSRDEATREAFLPNAGGISSAATKNPLKKRLFSAAGAAAAAAGGRGARTTVSSESASSTVSTLSAEDGGEWSQAAAAVAPFSPESGDTSLGGTSKASSSNSLNDLETMHTRAKTNVTFQYLRLGQLIVFVSYHGKNWSMLEDFDSLQVKVHPFVFRNRTCTTEELLVSVRNHVVIDILSQVNRNFVNIGAFLASKFSGAGAGCCDSSATQVLKSEYDSDNDTDAPDGGSPENVEGSGDAESGQKTDSGRSLLFGHVEAPSSRMSKLKSIKNRASKMFGSPNSK